MSKLVALVLTLAIGSPLLAAENTLPWPRFRGPNGSGVAHDEKPPIEIGPDKNVKWKVPTPSGLSSPIIVGDLLVITALDDGKLYTIAYNRADGSEAWRAHAPAGELEAFHKSESSPAASTSATDGERIVSYFGSCGLFCYDLEGNELWKLEMPPAATLGNYGSGVSPIIVDDTVVLLRDVGDDSRIIAVDLQSGNVKWEQVRTSKGGFSTPVVWDTPDGKQIAAAGHQRLIGYDLKSGTEKWFVEGMPTASCTSPVISDGDLYFAAWSPGAAGDTVFKFPQFKLILAADADKDGSLSKSELKNTPLAGFFDPIDENKDQLLTESEWDSALALMAAAKNRALVLKPGGSGDVTATHIKWQNTEGLPYVPSAIVYDGQYVMVKDGGIVTAYNASTGDELFQKRAAASGSYYASPVAANGHIYLSSLSDGTITVLKSGSDAANVVAKNPPLGERLAATPAIADDTLYVRTASHLYAFAETK